VHFESVFPEFQEYVCVKGSELLDGQLSESQRCSEQTSKFRRKEISCQSGSTTRTVKKNGAQYILTGAKTGVKTKFSVP